MTEMAISAGQAAQLLRLVADRWDESPDRLVFMPSSQAVVSESADDSLVAWQVTWDLVDPKPVVARAVKEKPADVVIDV